MKKIKAIGVVYVLCLLQYSSFAQIKARLNHTAIYVVDLKKSGDFYGRVAATLEKQELRPPHLDQSRWK